MVRCTRDESVTSGIYYSTKCEQSVVSDLKTVRMPYCSIQRQRDIDTPWTYGKTAVDLNSTTSSLLGTVLAFVIVYTKEEGIR